MADENVDDALSIVRWSSAEETDSLDALDAKATATGGHSGAVMGIVGVVVAILLGTGQPGKGGWLSQALVLALVAGVMFGLSLIIATIGSALRKHAFMSPTVHMDVNFLSVSNEEYKKSLLAHGTKVLRALYIDQIVKGMIVRLSQLCLLIGGIVLIAFLLVVLYC
jgi:hypothetical protein